MSDKRIFILAHRQARAGAELAIHGAPDGYIVTISEPTRTLEQNAKFHAICSDVAKQGSFMGRKLTALQWKTLFVSGHSIATERGADIVPGLEGEFVNIRESTATMGVRRKSSLIEYTLAWCAENGLALREAAAQGYEEMAQQCAGRAA